MGHGGVCFIPGSARGSHDSAQFISGNSHRKTGRAVHSSDHSHHVARPIEYRSAAETLFDPRIKEEDTVTRRSPCRRRLIADDPPLQDSKTASSWVSRQYDGLPRYGRLVTELEWSGDEQFPVHDGNIVLLAGRQHRRHDRLAGPVDLNGMVELHKVS